MASIYLRQIVNGLSRVCKFYFVAETKKSIRQNTHYCPMNTERRGNHGTLYRGTKILEL